MSWCSVVGCHNESKKNDKVTYHQLPRDKTQRELWIKAINRTSLPKSVFVCSDHFEEKYFDKSWDLQNSLLYQGRAQKRKLISGAVPTKFPHKPSPPARSMTIKRRAAKEQKEVCCLCIILKNSSTDRQRDEFFVHINVFCNIRLITIMVGGFFCTNSMRNFVTDKWGAFFLRCLNRHSRIKSQCFFCWFFPLDHNCGGHTKGVYIFAIWLD